MSTLKQLAASVTASKHKREDDIFSIAHLQIVGLLFVWGITVAVVIYLCVTYLLEYLTISVPAGTLTAPLEIFTNNWRIDLLVAALVILVISVVCGYLIMKIAMGPIKKALDLQKSFVSGIAHELRTPLSVLRLNNELARTKLASNAELVSLFEENMIDIDRITEMLSTLLNYDRLLRAKVIQFEMVNLQKILIIVTSRLAETAKLKNIDLLLTPGAIREIYGNQAALEQAFFNILENAITYSPSGSDILISSAESANVATVTIKDSGVGIPEKDLSHIFEPFYRSEKTGKLSSIGIGLAIVDQVIRLHKGDVKVTSQEGHGTEFVITLPLPSGNSNPS